MPTRFGDVIYKLVSKLFDANSLFCALTQLLERGIKIKSSLQPLERNLREIGRVTPELSGRGGSGRTLRLDKLYPEQSLDAKPTGEAPVGVSSPEATANESIVPSPP